jgi:hypothetical protein
MTSAADAWTALHQLSRMNQLTMVTFMLPLNVVGSRGEAVVILLAGGTKKRQDRDIAAAHERWADYKKRKALEK